MKEVECQSPFVGKIITCFIHNRSFQIEKGDVLIEKPVTFLNKKGSRTYNIYYKKLPCGCEVRIN